MNLNTESLSSDDIFDTNIAIAWSTQILRNAEKGIALPRIFLSQLPNDLDKYDSARKKKLFISILLPIALTLVMVGYLETKINEGCFFRE